MLTAFVLLEQRQRLPMLDLSLFRNSTFAGANATMLLVALAMFGVFFFLSLYMQQILGFSPTKAGAAFLPMTLLIVLVAPIAGRLSDRLGSRLLMSGGMVLVAIQLLIFSRLDATSTYWNLLPGLILGGFGMALAMTPTTAAAMGAVAVDKAGVGSAVLNSMRQVGGSLGIAVMGAIVAASIHVPKTDPLAAQQFVNGFQNALMVAAAIAAAGAVVAFVTVRKTRHADEVQRRGARRVSTATRPRLTAAELLETACRTFSKGSYRGTTTAAIARDAGVSEPILYRHFTSKRDL